MIEAILIGLLAAGITHFINYCLGSPASEKFSPYEIFSFYTVWLSIRRLKQVGLYDQYSEQYHDNLKRISTKHELITLKNDFKKILYNAADNFFTWERAVGMCPVCTGVWIAFIVSLIHSVSFTWINFLHLVIIVVVSHIVIRLLNKIL